MTVTIVPAATADRTVIENLFQLYVHDFSAFWVRLPRGELEDDGKFDVSALPEYWAGEGQHPYLIRVDGRLAGFALVRAIADPSEAIDFDMVEYFVVRKHRGTGVAAEAAHQIFLKHRGVWELAVARRNTPALSFWRRCVKALPGAREVVETDYNDETWNGPVLQFRI